LVIRVIFVFARALGKRGTIGIDATVMLCGYDDYGNEICSIDNKLELDSHIRPGKFTNVTANLLYLYNVTIDGCDISFRNRNGNRHVRLGKDVSLLFKKCEVKQVRCAEEG
jgi:hypothetical protein